MVCNTVITGSNPVRASLKKHLLCAGAFLFFVRQHHFAKKSAKAAIPAYAENNRTVVRVGWHEPPYFITDESGRKSGYSKDTPAGLEAVADQIMYENKRKEKSHAP